MRQSDWSDVLAFACASRRASVVSAGKACTKQSSQCGRTKAMRRISAQCPQSRPGLVRIASRIHGEMKMLGYEISERTVLRWMHKAPRNPEPGKRWVTFLSSHREAIAAMTFGTLYCIFVIAHDRRRVLHCNVTIRSFWRSLDCYLRKKTPSESTGPVRAASPRYILACHLSSGW